MLNGQDYGWVERAEDVLLVKETLHTVEMMECNKFIGNQDHMLMCMPSLVSDLLWAVVQ